MSVWKVSAMNSAEKVNSGLTVQTLNSGGHWYSVLFGALMVEVLIKVELRGQDHYS